MVKLSDLKKGSKPDTKDAKPGVAPSVAFADRTVPESPRAAPVAPASEQEISVSDLSLQADVPDMPASPPEDRTVRETPAPVAVAPTDDVRGRLAARLARPAPVQSGTGFAETVAARSTPSELPAVNEPVEEPPELPVAALPRSGGNAKLPKEKKWVKPVIYLAAAAAIAIIAMYHGCGKKVVPPATKPCADPTPKTCDLRSSPFAMFFDEKTCGYCGETDPDGRFVRKDWMTPANCPVVFSCGNGKVDKNEPYPVYVKGKDGTFELSVTSVSESCNPKAPNYCEVDCPKPKPKTHAAPKPVADKPVHADLPDCATTDKTRMRDAMTQIRGSMLDVRGGVDTKHADVVGIKLDVSYKALIESTGDVSLVSASTQQGYDIKGLVKMGSVKVTSGAADCEFKYTTSIPASN